MNILLVYSKMPTTFWTMEFALGFADVRKFCDLTALFVHKLRDIRAAFLVLWKLGLTGTQWLDFWKHIAWTLTHTPRELRSALMFTILSYHLQKMRALSKTRVARTPGRASAPGYGLISSKPATLEMPASIDAAA